MRDMDEELIREAIRLDYSQLVINNVYLHKENERLNNIINELKVCNSIYYNQINTMASKLSLINRYISNSDHELSVDSYYKFKDLCEFDEIKRIIFDDKLKVVIINEKI